MADAPSPAAPLLIEALIYLGALGFDVTMVPDAGLWLLMIGEDVVTLGEIVARAVALGMMGHNTAQ